MKNEYFHGTGGTRVGVAQRPPLDPQKYREKTPKTCMNGEKFIFVTFTLMKLQTVITPVLVS